MGLFSKSVLTEDRVLAELRKIKDPDLQKDVVSLGFIKNLQIKGGDVSFDFVLTTPACPAKDMMRDEAIQLVGALTGVERVNVRPMAKAPTAAKAGRRIVR